METAAKKWITHREAAEILGVHVSLIPKMLRRGDLASRPEGRRPSLDGSSVSELARRRAERTKERDRMRARLALGPQPPDRENVWLLIGPAAAVLGTTAAHLSNKVGRGQVPCTTRGHRRWFRRDHLEMILRARHVERSVTDKDASDPR